MTPVTEREEQAFREDLLRWFAAEARAMPWRGASDLYAIWVSEVMLQQTRVDQATPYYERFMRAYPTVERLAEAAPADVLRLWEGLGYYARARNLHRAAQRVAEAHGGAVPETPDAFRSLPGVGAYTAAAVLSIGRGVPLAAVDGNVTRVLARVFAVAADVKAPEGRRLVDALAARLLDPVRPGPFNEALMELGAMVCTPRAPACPRCPLQHVCRARAEGAPERYPVARRRPPTPHFDAAVGVLLNARGEAYVQQRPEAGLLGGLWEFPGGKLEPGESAPEACRRELREELGIGVRLVRPLCIVKHAYTHFRVTLYVFVCAPDTDALPELPGRWALPERLTEYPMPRANRKIIEALARASQEIGLFEES